MSCTLNCDVLSSIEYSMFYFFTFLVFIFGLCIGSFLNCLIWRLHEEKTLGGRSICPKCQHQLAWYDNIPVFSFLFLRGKCRYCHKAISWQYPAVEFITGILFLLAFASNFQFSIFNFQTISNFQFLNNFDLLFTNYYLLITIIRDWLIISVMTVIFIYDLRWYLILDKVSLPFIVIFFILNLILGFGWQGMVLAMLAGGGFFFLQFAISRGRWIGGGDIRLGVLMGAALGRLDLLLFAILASYFIGSIIAIFLVIFGKKQWQSQVPLGIFLTSGTILSLFWGQAIVGWYLNLLV